MTVDLTQFNTFQSFLKEIKYEISQETLSKIVEYKNILVEWNKIHNLTAIRDEEGIEIKHFVDSSTLISLIAPTNQVIIDIGTGAGFPGLVLSILYPQNKVILVESIKKKVEFLTHVIEKLELANVSVYHGRIEDFSKTFSSDSQNVILVGRAVSALSNILEWTDEIFRKHKNTHGFFQKSKDASHLEIEELDSKVRSKFDFEIIPIDSHNIRALENRVVIHVQSRK